MGPRECADSGRCRMDGGEASGPRCAYTSASQSLRAYTDLCTHPVDTVIVCVDEAVKKLEALGHKATDIKAIGITNQRETALVWSKST